jgi:hypothetical protein
LRAYRNPVEIAVDGDFKPPQQGEIPIQWGNDGGTLVSQAVNARLGQVAFGALPSG